MDWWLKARVESSENPRVRTVSRVMSRRSRRWTEQRQINPVIHINALCREDDVDVRGPCDENDRDNDGELHGME